MLDFTKIQNLKPIPSVRGTEMPTKRPVFSITISKVTHRPVLSTDAAAEDYYRLPEEDMRVIREINRVGSGDFESLSGWTTASCREADILDNPYLITMLYGNSRVTGIDGLPVVYSDETAVTKLELTPSDDGKTVTPSLLVTTGEERADNPVFLTDSIVMDGHVIYRVRPAGNNFREISEILVPFERTLLETYLSLFLSYFTNITPVWLGNDATFTQSVEKSVPTIVLEKVASDQALYLRVTSTLESSGEELNQDFCLTRAATVTDEDKIIVRNIDNPPLDHEVDMLESMIIRSAPSRMARKDIYRDGNFFIIPAETASPFLLNNLQQVLASFRLLGSERLKEYRITAASPKLNLRLSSGIDFLEGDADVEIEGESFTLSDLLQQFKRKRYIQLADGNRAIVDTRYISRLQRLFDRRDASGRVRVSFFDLPEIEDLIKAKVSGDFAQHAREVFQGFNSLKDKAPEGIRVNAELRPYQRDGVTWLEYLADNNLGGCLADDMGLGKTLQTIALLSSLYPMAERPTLVVMPRSLLFNWEDELSKFAPQLSVSVYYGPDRNLDKCLKSNIVLTTYAVTRNDIERMKDIKFECVILDESQNIKNTASQTAQAVTLLDSRLRFALSGTPMENNLTEIYSLFRFLNPTMFGTLENFNSTYTYPIQKDGDAEAMQSLRRKIYPFMMRRVKKDVLTELPDRIEQSIFVEMSESQKRLYENRRLAYRQEIENTIATSGVAKAQFVMLQALNELRRIASVPESMTDGSVTSPKISELIDSLSSAVQNGHKCVVFFNYIAGLELTGSRLDELGIQFESMTGSTATGDRKKIVGRFQSDPECMVLLMTLKVGGVGLNLTAADTVYIFEPWWNKAAEEQAINRLHRIGQKATVNTFSIITVGSIEEKIRQLQQQKSELFNQLISSDSASTKSLSEEDIDFILS